MNFTYTVFTMPKTRRQTLKKDNERIDVPVVKRK